MSTAQLIIIIASAMNNNGEYLNYSSKYKQKRHVSPLVKEANNLKAKVKIKLDPLQPNYFSKQKTSRIVNQGKNNYYSVTPSLHLIENKSKIYESAIRKHLRINLVSRESIESDNTPLIKIINQTPSKFHSKFSDFSLSDLDPPSPLMKTEVEKINKKRPKKVNFSIGSKFDLNTSFSPSAQGSLEELRLFLNRVKNS